MSMLNAYCVSEMFNMAKSSWHVFVRDRDECYDIISTIATKDSHSLHVPERQVDVARTGKSESPNEAEK